MTLSTTLLIYSSLACLLFWLLNKFQRRRLQHYASKFDGPLALPLIGSAFYLFASNKQLAKNVIYLTNKFKSPWKIWLGPQLYIILSKPEDMEIVLHQALDKGDNYKFLVPLLNSGLVTAPATKWKRHRRIVRNTFKMPVLNDYVCVFAKHSQKLVETLDSHVGDGYFDVYPMMNRNALNITCETAIGVDYIKRFHNANYTDILAEVLDVIFRRFFCLWQQPEFMWKLSGNARKVGELSKRLHTILSDIIADKRRADYKPERESFLDHLIRFSKQDDWSDAELVEEAMTMTAAGSDSLGSGSSYTLLMLGMHPHVQDKVYEELFDIFGRSNRSVAHEDLPKMVYLEQVVKETLRLFPLTVGVTRHLEKDITISNGHVLPEGSDCIIAFMYTHRDSEIWTNSFHFDPDRFTSEETAKRHPFSFVPFSGGPRNCIGFKYALMAIKTIVATVVRSYKISTDYKNVLDVELEPGVILKPVKGQRVALEKRI